VFLLSSLILVLALPLCYAESRIRAVCQAPEPSIGSRDERQGWIAKVGQVYDTWVGRVLLADHSAGTVICVVVFLGVLVRVIQTCQRFDQLEERLKGIHDLDTAISASRHADLAPLLAGIDDDGRWRDERSDRLLRFHRNLLLAGSATRRCEDYLVAVGLIGTLLAFYLGFAERLSDGLSFASLDETARQLLTVVGTAAMSSVAGIGLGMLAVPPLVDHLARRRRQLVELASETLGNLEDTEP